jgi:CheY-like chemotaxis protein
MALTGAGHHVVLASDGREAMELVERHKFHLVITDLVMPNREGIEVIRQLRQAHPKLKIIAVSGAFGGRFLRAAAMLGADATLAKPVTPDQLLDAVRRLLG